jgi:hypothetical protein
MEQEQPQSGNIFRTGPDDLHRMAAALAQEGIPIPIDKGKADVVLVTSAVEILLFKDALRAAARVLNHLGAGARACTRDAVLTRPIPATYPKPIRQARQSAPPVSYLHHPTIKISTVGPKSRPSSCAVDSSRAPMSITSSRSWRRWVRANEGSSTTG